MSLSFAARPRLLFFSQTVDGRPYVNCLPYTICMVLRWAGWAVPIKYGMTLRKAAGVPVEEGLGTSYAQMSRALLSEFGAHKGGVVFGKIADDDLLADLPKWGRKNTTRDVYSVVCQMELLPRHLRRLVGYTWKGRHAIGLGGVRVCDGVEGGRHTGHKNVTEVWWMDPMGRTTHDYYGEWVPYSTVRDTLDRKDGMVICIHAERNAAHSI